MRNDRNRNMTDARCRQLSQMPGCGGKEERKRVLARLVGDVLLEKGLTIFFFNISDT